jgi:hypothetical protein
MDELAFLIIDRLGVSGYYNSASLVNLYPRDADFSGYSETQVLQEFFNLIDQKILILHPIAGGTGPNRNYMLSEEKGAKAYLKEKQLREEKVKNAELQKKLTESVIKANNSVVETNESVAQTNKSVQATNDLVSANIPRQNRLTRASVMVAIVAVVVAAAPFINSIRSNSDTQLLQELKEVNKIMKEQGRELNTLIKQQNEIDSMLVRNNTTNEAKRAK